MSRMVWQLRRIAIIFAAIAFAVCLAALAQAQSTQPASSESAGAARSNGGDRAGAPQGYFTAAQMQRLRETLEASDDEWKVIEPRIEKIESIRRAIQTSRFGNRGRRGNPTNTAASNNAAASPITATPSPALDRTELQTASQQLQEALDNKETKPQELKARLAALREARAHAQTELTKAQNDLREILSSRQEAVLVTYGLLN